MMGNKRIFQGKWDFSQSLYGPVGINLTLRELSDFRDFLGVVKNIDFVVFIFL